MLNILLTCSGRKNTFNQQFLDTIERNSKIKFFLCDNNSKVISKYFGNFFLEVTRVQKKILRKYIIF